FTVTFFVSYLMRGSARSPLFPYTTLFRSAMGTGFHQVWRHVPACIVAALTLFACVLAVALVMYLTRLMLLVQLGFFTTLYALLRSEEHTSELQSRFDIVWRLLLEKKKCCF